MPTTAGRSKNHATSGAAPHTSAATTAPRTACSVNAASRSSSTRPGWLTSAVSTPVLVTASSVATTSSAAAAAPIWPGPSSGATTKVRAAPSPLESTEANNTHPPALAVRLGGHGVPQPNRAPDERVAGHSGAQSSSSNPRR